MLARMCDPNAAPRTPAPALDPPLLGLSLQALDGACDQALRLGRHAATARLAGFLLELLSERPGQNELQLAMKRADIAAHLGLNKESVSRSFTQLRRAGAIALPRPDRVHLLRPDRLRELAHSTHPHPVLQPAPPLSGAPAPAPRPARCACRPAPDPRACPRPPGGRRRCRPRGRGR